MNVKAAFGERSAGNEKCAIGNWKKGDSCYTVAAN